jgi:selenophosphate synthetase-related protein
MLLADTTMPCGAVAVLVAVIVVAVTGGACEQAVETMRTPDSSRLTARAWTGNRLIGVAN